MFIKNLTVCEQEREISRFSKGKRFTVQSRIMRWQSYLIFISLQTWLFAIVMWYFCLVFHRFKLDAEGQLSLSRLSSREFGRGNNTHREVAFLGFHLLLFLFSQEHVKRGLFDCSSNFGRDKLALLSRRYRNQSIGSKY